MTKQELTGRVYAPCEAKLDDGTRCEFPVKITTEIRNGAPCRCEKHPIAPVEPIWPGAGEPQGVAILKDTLTLREITDGTPDCACKFVPGRLNLQRCPLHAAAQELLNECETVLAVLDGLTPFLSHDFSLTRAGLRTVIAKAKGS